MGAPKQKWTAEEEAALKAGIQKYGTGKWSTILKDPEFSTVLRARSNVDLKDKFRNLNCMANGMGSRNRARVAVKSNPLLTNKQEDDATVRDVIMAEKESDVVDGTSHASSSEVSQDAGSRKPISRLDDLIVEAITKLKEPRGSNRATIAQYIEEHYSPIPDFEKTLARNLKILTESGRLVKVKNQYRIAPKSVSLAAVKEQPMFSANGVKGLPPSEAKTTPIVLLTKADIDAELEKMKKMSAADAAAAAAKAVAEAEAAIAEAEAAAREAEEAEAEAEAARCFADAAQKALTCPTVRA
ncbi:telomere repeat-binding factor 1 isoform X2 [Andrographis paniculata]|nr:telomere repeat-binding factor 1 isoform X2 [Andrographis paniculata]